MKLLHTADWQIGKRYSQFESGDASLLAHERIEGVRRIAELATQEQVDAVLVAGDVFDTQTPLEKTIVRTFDAMKAYAGPWFLIAGNHDAALAESVWTVAQRWNVISSNVVLCLTPQVVEVTVGNSARLAILPAPLTQRHTHLDLTEWFDTANTTEGAFRVGLAHGCVDGILPSDVDSVNPIAAQRTASAKLDYLALGDWHGLRQVDDRAWYSGTHEPDRFRDNDPGHVLLVELDSPGSVPRVRPVRVGRFQWRKLLCQVSDGADVERVLGDLAALDATTVAEVALAGTCDMAGQGKLESALAAAARRCAAFSSMQSELRLEPTQADLEALQADGFVGAALAALRQQLQGPDAELARDALLQLARIQREVGQSAKAAA